jgi:hypothetical protein
MMSVSWYQWLYKTGPKTMPWNVDWIALDANIFGQTLDGTVIAIHSAAYQALTSALEKQREGLKDWSESDTGISEGQYEDYITEGYMIQVGALTTVSLTLMESQFHSFLKANTAFLERHFPRRKEPCGRKSWLLWTIAEYRERYGIEIEGLPGFETCREVVLARNSCVHAECEPNDDYMKQTDFWGQIAQPPVRNAGSDSMLGSCSTFVVAWSRPNTADGALSAIPPPETCQA